MPSLRHSTDREAGFYRRRHGQGFSYYDEAGRRVTDERQLERFRGLVIPPAWTEVWICRSGRGHLQATGRDSAGRKQYRYHPAWRADRDREKYERVVAFAERLPAMRRTVQRHLREGRLHRERALAAAVAVLDRTGVRIGCEEYARGNNTFGLATLRSRHLTLEGDRVILDFSGKAGARQRVELDDRRLAKTIAAMERLPGHEVFKYRGEDGEIVDVRSGDINDYIKTHMGEAFSAKDFRTWAATVAAAVALDQLDTATSGKARSRAVASVVRAVADLLGNTPAVCRSSYIDPRVIDHYLDGCTLSTLREPGSAARQRGRSAQEALVLALLRHGFDDAAKRAA